MKEMTVEELFDEKVKVEKQVTKIFKELAKKVDTRAHIDKINISVVNHECDIEIGIY